MTWSGREPWVDSCSQSWRWSAGRYFANWQAVAQAYCRR
jgi:hypothetical protein